MRNLFAEEEIESWFERRMDRLDEKLISDQYTQEQYDEAVKKLSEEADELYRKAGFVA